MARRRNASASIEELSGGFFLIIVDEHGARQVQPFGSDREAAQAELEHFNARRARKLRANQRLDAGLRRHQTQVANELAAIARQRAIEAESRRERAEQAPQRRQAHRQSPAFKALLLHHARKRKVRQKMPAFADENAIKAIYAQARQITRATGIAHHVDHYYPLKGRAVSGLHVHQNLRVVPAGKNLAKHNRMPDDPECWSPADGAPGARKSGELSKSTPAKASGICRKVLSKQ